jgi:hypothetical protein
VRRPRLPTQPADEQQHTERDGDQRQPDPQHEDHAPTLEATRPPVGQDERVLDHLVLAVPDLAAAVAEFRRCTGVDPAPGGSHLGLGTANHLVDLGGGSYLEIVGPDPAQPEPEQPRPFGIDDLAAPQLVTWALRTRDIDALVTEARASGYDPGAPTAMSRRTPDGALLEWRLTAPQLAHGGLVPFVIDWRNTPHPTSRGLPRTELIEFRASSPEPAAVLSALAALRAELPVAAGAEARLSAVVQGRHGPVEL